MYITQEHEEGRVTLDFDVALELFTEEDNTRIEVIVTDPEGRTYVPAEGADPEDYRIVITDPKLWWPRGYGEQPLYQVKLTLFSGDGTVLDTYERRIGLRTLTVNTDKDEWGECFAHEVNGVKIFAMGADYIPEDNLFSRINKERTRKLLSDAAAVNHNVSGSGAAVIILTIISLISVMSWDFWYGRTSCLPVPAMSWMMILNVISQQKSGIMSEGSGIMPALPCGVVITKWRHRR